MIVGQTEIEAIMNPRVRRRVLELAIQRGRLGEALRCPLRAGSVYVLRGPSRFATLKAEAEQQPSRARGVLWLCDQAQEPPQVQVTVMRVAVRGDRWVVQFVLGDQRAKFDEPRLLAARSGAPSGDYTTNPARAMRGEPEAVGRDAQERYSREANERDELRLEMMRARAVDAIEDILPFATGRERKRLREAAYRIRSLGDTDSEAA